MPVHNIGALSHGIPLLALSQRLPSSYTPGFLALEHFHAYFRSSGVQALDIPHDAAPRWRRIGVSDRTSSSTISA